MYHKKYIIPGLVIAVVLFSAPFWLNIGKDMYEYPNVSLPTDNEWSTCIESTEWMRANHMNLLNIWRDEAIRNGKRVYRATDGRYWSVSLQDTCTACHVNKVDFCDKCHDSNNVQPYCWDCHVEPRGNN